MSRWQHNMCLACWRRRNGGRVPVQVVDADREHETCCFCGGLATHGIYIRWDPAELNCDHSVTVVP